MAKRRRKTRRTGNPRTTALPNPASARGGFQTSPTSARNYGRKAAALRSDMDGGAFLGPEQQYLLRVRREVERRAARKRRLAVGLALGALALVAAAVARLSGWI